MSTPTKKGRPRKAKAPHKPNYKLRRALEVSAMVVDDRLRSLEQHLQFTGGNVEKFIDVL